MAIFSSKNKHKKNEGSGSNSGQSPPIGGGGFPRSGSSQQSGLGNSVNGPPGSGSSGIPVLSSSQQGYSQQAPSGIPPPGSLAASAGGHSVNPSSNAPPTSGTPSHTVLYPWSQRRITLLPSQLLAPPSAHPASPSAPILGPGSPPPFPRYGHSVNPLASANGDLYVFGGLVANSVKNDLYLVSCASPQFGSGPNSPLGVSLVETRGEVPGPRVGHASVGVGNVLIVWGGDTKSRPEERQDDGLYLLNLSTREWTRVKTLGPAPEGRYGHAAAMVGSKFFIFGGQTDDHQMQQSQSAGTTMVPGGFKNDLCWFDLQKLKLGQPRWSFVEYSPDSVVPPPRTGHTCVTYGDALYIFGGTDGQYHYNDTWCFDLATQTWTELSCIGYIPVPREGHAATLVDDVMYVFGGRGVDGKDLEDLAAFKIGTQRWFMFQNMGPAPSGRSGHAMATWQNKVLVLGGESYTSSRADDPASVHTLDTTKIKYPPDAARPPQSVNAANANVNAAPPPQSLPSTSNLPPAIPPTGAVNNSPMSRKTSIPVMQNAPSSPNGPSMIPTPSSRDVGPERGLPTPDELLRQRAASPTGSVRGNGLKSSTGSLNGSTANPAAVASSIGQLMTNGNAGSQQPPAQLGPGFGYNPNAGSGSKIAKRTTTTGAFAPPTRPARPGDEDFGTSSPAQNAGSVGDRRTMDPSGVGLGLGSPSQGQFGERALSPTGSAGSRIGGLRKTSGGGGPAPNGVRDRAASPTNLQSTAQQAGSLNAFAAQQKQNQTQPGYPDEAGPSALAPAVSSLPSTTSPPVQAPADAFYYGGAPPRNGPPPAVSHQASPQRGAPGVNGYGRHVGRDMTSTPPSSSATPVDSSALRSKDEEISRLKAQQQWMVVALQSARRKGFAIDESEVGEDRLRSLGDEPDGDDPSKRELVEILVALKGELAKTKSEMANHASKLDRKLSDANRQRGNALQEAAYYRAKLSALETGSAGEVNKLDRERASDLERRLADALAARQSLETKVSKLEQEVDHHSTMRSAAEERYSAAVARAEAAEGSHSRALSDFADLQKRSQGHESTIADHLVQLAALTSSSQALSTENDHLKSRSAEHEASLAQHVRTIEEVQVALAAANARNDELLPMWEKASHELTEQHVKVAQLERDLETARAENVTAMAKVEELERILKSTKDAHDATQVFASGGLAELLASHKERSLKNASRGLDGTLEDAQDAGAAVHLGRVRALENELGSVKQYHTDSRAKADTLAAELADARAREAELHSQIAQLRADLSKLQSQHATARDDLGRHRALLDEREAEAKEAAKTREAAEVKVGILRNLMADHGLAVNDADLVPRPMTGTESAEQLYQRVQELETRLEQKTKAHSELDSTHQSTRRELDDLARQRDEHADELQRLGDGSASDPEEKERLARVQGELETLQQRHSQLEATHLKAVQYVKGTEKMLRRMKEELTRYKERCEELESPERQAEVENLRRQVDEHRSKSESSARQVEDHQRSMSALQSEFQRNLRESQAESQHKIDELNEELSRLDQELEKAHADLEETLAVNASLNKELQTALKNPASPRLGSQPGSEDVQRLQTELEQAQNKAEWLKRENASLEQRCRTAESKIAILLDHMEGVSDPYEANGQGPAGDFSQDFDPQHGHDWTTTAHGRAGSISDGESEYSEQHRR
ncbi:hypothetical protein JCM10212_003691 [Sporobolomyces blumeae]